MGWIIFIIFIILFVCFWGELAKGINKIINLLEEIKGEINVWKNN